MLRPAHILNEKQAYNKFATGTVLLAFSYSSENVDDTRESPALQLLEKMEEHLAFGVKVFDPFVKERIVDHQFMNFEDFINEIEIIVIMVGHDHIKNNIDLIKDKLVLDTRNICTFDGAYKL